MKLIFIKDLLVILKKLICGQIFIKRLKIKLTWT